MLKKFQIFFSVYYLNSEIIKNQKSKQIKRNKPFKKNITYFFEFFFYWNFKNYRKIVSYNFDHLFSLVNLQENSELIQNYLLLLKLRSEKQLATYQPTSWESLSKEEQLQLAIFHLHQHQEEDLENQLKLNQVIREYKNYKKEQKELRKINKS